MARAPGACRAAALGECAEIPQKFLKEDRDAWGHTALMIAVMHGQAGAADALLKAGADPYAPQTLLGLPMIRFMNAAVPLQHPDLTAAMRAAYAGLFPNGLPAQSDDDAISTDQFASIASMHHLVRRGNVNRIRRLLELGVNPALRNSKGLTVLQIAEQTREAEAEKLIRQWDGSARPADDDETAAEADPVPPQASEVPQSGQKNNYPVRRLQELNAQKLIEEGDIPGLQILISRGGTPDSVMSNKALMLVHACRTNRESFLFLLLAGASPALKDDNGDSAEEAAQGSELRTSYIREFSTCGRKNNHGNSSDLISAVLAEDLSTAAVLGASNPQLINEAGAGGVTPLGIAVQRGNLMLCRILLDLGADPWQKCLGPLIPVECASRDDVRTFLETQMSLMKGWVFHNSRTPFKTSWYESARKAVDIDLYGPDEAEEEEFDVRHLHRSRTEVILPQQSPEPVRTASASISVPEPAPVPAAHADPNESAQFDLSFIDDAASSPEPAAEKTAPPKPLRPEIGSLEDDDWDFLSDGEEEAEAPEREENPSGSGRTSQVLPPSAASLSESLRGLGYSLGDAVTDIIDNSISAGSGRVWVDYSLTTPSESWLSIRDCGSGMNDEELRNAMRLGSRSPKMLRGREDLGRFGLGLKTASFSQCRRLTVCSKKEGKVAAYVWDLDALAEADEWVLGEASAPLEDDRFRMLADQESGTVVLWEKVDRAFGSCEAAPLDFRRQGLEALERLRKNLRLTFHQFLTDDQARGSPELEILFGPGAGKVEPWDPFFSASFASPRRYQEEYWPSDSPEPQVSLKPYVVPDPSSSGESITLYGEEDLLDMQGFFIYRGKRLICRAGWLNLGIPRTPLHALARIKLVFDSRHDLEWQLDIRKSTVRIPRKKGWNRLRQLLCCRANDAAATSEKVLSASLEKPLRPKDGSAGPLSCWRRERGAAPQIDFTDRLGAAYRMALANASNPDVVQGLLELLAYSHPSCADRAQYASPSPLARAAIVELAYVIAEGEAENVPQALAELEAHEPFCYWPGIMDEFKEEDD